MINPLPHLLRALFSGPSSSLQAAASTGDKRSASTRVYKEVAVEDIADILAALPDPDLLIKKLGTGRYELRKLETDDEIFGALDTRREAVMAVDWHLDPVEGEQAEWLRDHLDLHLDTILRNAWSAVPYGYSVQEAVYAQLDSGRIGLDRIVLKPLEWFEPRRDGELWMRLPGSSSPVVVDQSYKFFATLRNPTYRNPYGDALLTRCYWPWFFRHNAWRFWMRFLERFGDPLLLGQVDDPTAFVAAMQTLGMEAVLGVSREEAVTAVTPSGRGEFAVVEQKLIERLQRLILGQLASSGDAGGFSKGQMQENVRIDKRNADIRLVSGTVQRITTALWELNSFPGEPPRFVMEDALGLEPERAERDAVLVNAGICSLTQEYLINNYDFEEGDVLPPAKPESSPPPEDPEAEEDPGADPQGGRGEDMAGGRSLPLVAPRSSLAASGDPRYTPDQEELEELIEGTLAEGLRGVEVVPMAAIQGAISRAESPEELAELLGEIYLGNDPVEFRAILERSLFCADILGYVNSETRRGEA